MLRGGSEYKPHSNLRRIRFNECYDFAMGVKVERKVRKSEVGSRKSEIGLLRCASSTGERRFERRTVNDPRITDGSTCTSEIVWSISSATLGWNWRFERRTVYDSRLTVSIVLQISESQGISPPTLVVGRTIGSIY